MKQRFFILLAALGITLPFSACSHLVYQPSKAQFSQPKQAQIDYEEVEFLSRDGIRLTGWFFPAKGSSQRKPAPTVIQFHGNAENMTSHFFSLFWLTEAGYNLFVFDYRGYGRSDGTPNQAGVYLDAVSAIEYIQSRMPAQKNKADIVLYGQSLGGAVLARAIEGVRDRSRLSAVIIECSFHSYREIAQDVLSRFWMTYLFQPLAHVLISDEYSPERSFEKISPIPLLIIHGEKDRMVPSSFGKKIFELAQEPKDLWLIPEAAHMDSLFVSQGRNRLQLVEWLKKNRLARTTP